MISKYTALDINGGEIERNSNGEGLIWILNLYRFN